MPPIKFLLLLIPLVATSTQGFLMKKIDAGENANTGETYLENIKTIVQDVKDALHLKKQEVSDAVSEAVNAKIGMIKDIKDTKKNLVENILASKIAKVNAMKAAKEDFMKTIMEKKQSFFHNKPHGIQEATSPPAESLKSRLFNFFFKFFDKFQGQFEKDDKSHKSPNTPPLALILYPSSNSFSQAQESASSVQNSEPQVNFPSESTEADYQTTKYVSEPLENVKPMQTSYEFAQVEDVQHSGFQSNQFSPSSDYDKPKEDNYAPLVYPPVDFSNHQTNSHVSPSYYDSYSTSVK